MDVDLFDFELPQAAIAQQPAEPRDAARMLVVDRASGTWTHACVAELPSLLDPGDLLLVNDTRVIPARLHGRKESGGRVELFLLERLALDGPNRERWRALVSASRAPREGAQVLLPDGFVAALVRGPAEGGVAELEIHGPAPVAELLGAHGQPPLPPYIRREVEDARLANDRERYQTVFAREAGAVAAPTAGLHFTPELLARLAEAGIERQALTLHVGEGTFRTPSAERLADISLHPERFELPEETAESIARLRAREGRLVAVGTTVTRTLESRPGRAARVPAPGAGETSLFIRPGHCFSYVDVLLTNFHLPRSTLLMLVAAFAGRELVLDAYAEAIREGYRFYSYGDAMLVL